MNREVDRALGVVPFLHKRQNRRREPCLRSCTIHKFVTNLFIHFFIVNHVNSSQLSKGKIKNKKNNNKIWFCITNNLYQIQENLNNRFVQTLDFVQYKGYDWRGKSSTKRTLRRNTPTTVDVEGSSQIVYQHPPLTVFYPKQNSQGSR